MKLTNENISEVMEKTEEILVAEKVSQQDKIKVCLLMEEALLRYKEKFGENAEFRFIAKKWFSSPHILIRIRGDAYNPLAEKSEEEIFFDNVIKNLLHYEGADINYNYKDGFNEIRATYTTERKSFKIPGGKITVAVLLAVISSFLCDFLPEETHRAVTEELVTPVLNTLFHAVIAVNIPLVFINIVASICSVDDASSLNALAMKIMLRFAKILSFCLIVAFLTADLFFPSLNFGFKKEIVIAAVAGNTGMLELILSIVPQNIVEPFLKGNILQIVFLAALIGFCVTVLGNKVNIIKEFVTETKIIIFKMVSLVLKVMPLVVFLSIFKALSTDLGNELLAAWKILAATYIAYIVTVGSMLLKNYIKHKVDPISFLKKIYPPCLITFTTSSGNASLPKNLEICKDKLHIDDTLCNIYIPLSLALCPISRLIGMTVHIIFAAHFYGVHFSVIQLIILGFLLIQFSLSSANEAGGVMACMALLLTQLGFSLDVMSIIMIADIFVVNASGVAGVIVRDTDLYDMSRTMKV